jgi:hypothetical protein
MLGLPDRGDVQRDGDLVTDEQAPRANRLGELHIEGLHPDDEPRQILVP